MPPYVEHGLETSGTTANRPTNAEIGFRYFDTTIGKALVYNGTSWVAADGGAASVASVNAAGNSQATATLITPGTTVVGAGDGTKGVILSTAVINDEYWVKNDDNANAALPIYPPVGGSINLLAANASYNAATNTAVVLKAVSSTRFVTF
jgi:hypothetical protein